MPTPHSQCLTLSFFVYHGYLSPAFLNLKRFQWIGKRERDGSTGVSDFRELNSMGKADRPGRTDRTDDGNIASGVGGVMRGQDASKTLSEFG